MLVKSQNNPQNKQNFKKKRHAAMISSFDFSLPYLPFFPSYKNPCKVIPAGKKNHQDKTQGKS